MKKIVLSALLLAAVAVSASAEIYVGNNGVSYYGPNRGQLYNCTYSNYSGTAVNPGYSYWTLTVFQDASGKPMPRGTEQFLATDRYGNQFWEGFKATWAKPVNKIDPATYTTFTEWEYTFNPYGPQCLKAGVFFNAFKLTFNGCSDGHSRVCWLVQ
ncbi:MAG: hypothetical protein ACJ76J_18615 [Thermoanaerobaculia bacterium]